MKGARAEIFLPFSYEQFHTHKRRVSLRSGMSGGSGRATARKEFRVDPGDVERAYSSFFTGEPMEETGNWWEREGGRREGDDWGARKDGAGER